MRFNTDCQFWQGDKPCPQNRLCDNCRAYKKIGTRILIVKLGARGDVLRTTPLIAGLRKKYKAAHITWLTAPESLEILSNLPGLDRLLVLDEKSMIEIQARTFDIVICLDKEPWATGLAEIAKGSRKLGWGMAPDGTGSPRAFNPEGNYSLALGVSDELKFKKNRKTYLQIIFEAVGLTYAQEPYQFILTPQDREKARLFLKAHNLGEDAPILGLFTGCGSAFQRKRWTEEGFAVIAKRAKKELGATVLLLSGPEEVAINERIRSLAGVKLLDTRGEHNLREFGGFIEACRVLLTGDTIALHIAVALRRPALCLFGPTCEQEIDLFGQGEKVVSTLACSPCYRTTCAEKPTCMESISPEAVWEAVQRLWRPGS